MMHGYPSAAQIAAAQSGIVTVPASAGRVMFDPLWYYGATGPGAAPMGSWLSDLTGVHISSKGVSLSAPKIPAAITGKKAAAPVSNPVIVNVGATGTAPTPAAGVPVYTPSSTDVPGAQYAVLPDGTRVPVVQTGITGGAGSMGSLSSAGPLGIPMYGWLAIGAGAFLLLNKK